MSLFDDILDLVGLGGDDNTATATANNNVTVNPEITAVNVIDTEALGDALAGAVVLSSALEAEAADRRAESATEKVFDLLKVAGSVGVLFMVLKGKFG